MKFILEKLFYLVDEFILPWFVILICLLFILMGLDATGLELSPLFVFLGTIVEYIYKIFTSVLNFFYGDGDKESLGFFAFMLIVWFAFARLYDKYIQVHINKLRKKWFEN